MIPGFLLLLFVSGALCACSRISQASQSRARKGADRNGASDPLHRSENAQ